MIRKKDVTKIRFIEAWFREIEETIAEIDALIETKGKHSERIAAPALYALIERMAEIRYRLENLGSRERFKKILLAYSGKKKELQQVDLAFLYKWPTSSYKNEPIYKKNVGQFHSEIKKIIEKLRSGSEISSSMKERFIDADSFYENLIKNKISSSLKRESMNLFKMNEVIYRFGRCDTVHKLELGYISVSFLLFLVKQVSRNLKKVCMKSGKWPYELGVRIIKKKA